MHYLLSYRKHNRPTRPCQTRRPDCRELGMGRSVYQRAMAAVRQTSAERHPGGARWTSTNAGPPDTGTGPAGLRFAPSAAASGTPKGLLLQSHHPPTGGIRQLPTPAKGSGCAPGSVCVAPGADGPCGPGRRAVLPATGSVPGPGGCRAGAVQDRPAIHAAAAARSTATWSMRRSTSGSASSWICRPYPVSTRTVAHPAAHPAIMSGKLSPTM